MRRVLIATAAPVLLAVAGLFHPHLLLESTADRWTTLHIVLLPLFPLVALGFVVPLWGRPPGVATVLAWLGAFVYATFYTGLDAVAGIAAGTAGVHAPAGADLGPWVFPLFETGDALGRVGVVGFLTATLATSVDLFRRYGVRVLPGSLLLLVAGWSFMDSHIFWPRGVVTMLGFAVGFGHLAAVSRG